MISRTVIIAVLLTLLGKFLAFFKEVSIAYYFGTTSDTDAYFVANVIPSVIWLAIYSTITSVFLPLYIEIKEKRPEEAHAFVNNAIRGYLLISTVLALLCIVFARELVRATAPAAEHNMVELAAFLTQIMSVGFILTSYVGVQNALQQANGKYVAPLAVPVLNNVIAIAAIACGAFWGGITFAVVGATAAWVIQSILQRAQTRAIYPTQFMLPVDGSVWRRIAMLSIPAALAIFLDQINIFVGISMASEFGDGAISHLSYASRLVTFASGLFAWLISYFLFPSFAKNAILEDDLAGAKTLTKGAALIVFLTAPVAAASLALREDVVTFIYGRGAFSPEAVNETSLLFGFYGLGIMFIALRELLNKVFFSYQKVKVPLIIGLVALLTNLLSSYALSRYFGLSGIAVGASIAALTYFSLQVFSLWRWKPALISGELIRLLLIFLLAGFVAFLSGRHFFTNFDHMNYLLRLVIGLLIVTSVYALSSVAIMKALGIELRSFLDIVMNKRLKQ